MDRLGEWLLAHVPDDDEVSIVHGDFRSHNLIFRADSPEVAAILDWELSTIGHPVTDFAFHLMMYRVPPAIEGGGLKGLDLAASNIPSEADAVAAYCDRTGRSEEHTSELQSLMRISYAVFCLKKKKHTHDNTKK